MKKVNILMFDAAEDIGEYNEPLGIEVIAGFLKKNNAKANIEFHSQSIHGDINNDLSKYDIVALSLPFNSLSSVDKIYPKINFEKQFMMIGNSLSTFGYKDILGKYPNLICSLGEGEYSMLDLVEYIHKRKGFQDIRNIAYIKEGSLRKNWRVLVDANDIVMPERFPEVINFLKSKKGTFRIEGSRGCLYGGCSFCYIPGKYPNKTRRNVSEEQILKQIIELDKIGVKMPYFTDEDFIGGNFDRAISIAEKISEAKRNGIISQDMNFYFNTRAADVINPRWAELSSVFMEAGLNQVFVGIESGSKEQLKRFKKPTSVENNKKCLDILEQNGFNIEVGYILFDPYSTVKELKESLDFFDKTRLYNKRVYLIDNLKITPFSKFHDMAYTKQLALSPLNVQTVSYDYEFEDAKVQKIWNTASKWKRNVEKKYSTYEANTRGESNNIFFAEEAKILNYLEFQVISNLVKYADSGIKDYKELCQKSMKIYENIINHKSKGKRKQTMYVLNKNKGKAY